MVFGDFEGYMHLVDVRDGVLLNRIATDGAPVVLAPVVVGKNLVVATQRGGLYALAYE